MEAALLADHFHIFADRIGRLTPRYIAKCLYHERDKKTGKLRFRKKPKKDEPTTRESQHRNLDYLAAVLGASLVNYAEAYRAIDEKWDSIEKSDEVKKWEKVLEETKDASGS